VQAAGCRRAPGGPRLAAAIAWPSATGPWSDQGCPDTSSSAIDDAIGPPLAIVAGRRLAFGGACARADQQQCNCNGRTGFGHARITCRMVSTPRAIQPLQLECSAAAKACPFIRPRPSLHGCILHRLRRSRPSMDAVSTMPSGRNTISEWSLVPIRNPKTSHAFCDKPIVLWDLKGRMGQCCCFRTDPEPC
jgi:hypothetical protein